MELNEFNELSEKIKTIQEDSDRLGEAITGCICVYVGTSDASIVLNKSEMKRVRCLLIDIKLEQEKKLIELIGNVRINGSKQTELEELIDQSGTNEC